VSIYRLLLGVFGSDLASEKPRGFAPRYICYGRAKARRLQNTSLTCMMIGRIAARLRGSVVFPLALGGLFLTAQLGYALQQGQASGSMPGMDMSGSEMSNMGPSMAAMAGHMYITPLRPKQPADEERAKTVVAEVKAAIRAGIERSPLTDMAAHTRHLEQAYLQALEQRYPAALATRHG